jgi:hypothetical protein
MRDWLSTAQPALLTGTVGRHSYKSNGPHANYFGQAQAEEF